MASGTISGTTSNQYIVCKIEWSSTINITGNYSTVYASLYYKRTNAGYTTEGTGDFTLNISGYTSTAKSKHLVIGSDWVLAMMHSVVIAHNSDGEKSITISATGSLPPSSLTSTDCNGTAVLDAIPRATVPETIEEAQFGEEIRIDTPRASSAFTHKLEYRFGNLSGTIATGVAEYRSWRIPLTLANEAVGPFGGYCQINCTTYNNNTVIGTKSTKILLTAPDSMAPTIDNVTITPTADSQAAYDFFGGYIQGKSKLHITINASGQYSATIARCETTIDGVVYAGQEVTTNIISSATTLPLRVTVTDTRKKSTTYSADIVVLPYTPPSLEFKAERCLKDGTADDEDLYLRATIKYSIDNVNNLNTKSFLLFYQKDGDPQQTSLQFTGGYAYDGVYVSTDAILEADYAYNIRFSLLDYFTYIQADAQIPTAFTLVDYDSSGKGIAFGEVAQGDGMSVALNATFKKTVNFSENIKIDGVQIADYIVENGISGNWTYRKWASGIAECWGTAKFTCNLQASGSVYYTSGSVSLPFTFAADPLPIVSGSCPWNYLNWVNVFIDLSDLSKCGWLYYQTNDNGTGDARNVYIHVIGKLKGGET